MTATSRTDPVQHDERASAARQGRPVVSVVIVSDYASGEEKGWDQLSRTLRAVARQDFDEPAEHLLIENEVCADQMPTAVVDLLPSLKFVRSSATTSYALKNEGARIASAELLAILDADCAPAPDWLRHLVDVMRRHPEAAVVSGTVTYSSRTRLGRLLGLLDRTYLNTVRTGDTDSLNNNSTGFRRSVVIDHPLPDDTGPFFNKLYAQQLIRLGHRVLFEPRMMVTHDFEGWSMQEDIRRNIGFATIAMRIANPTMPYAWLIQLRFAAIPLIVVGKVALSIWQSARFAHAYGVAWYEVPLAWALAPVVRCLEVPGMIDALRGRRIVKTQYR